MQWLTLFPPPPCGGWHSTHTCAGWGWPRGRRSCCRARRRRASCRGASGGSGPRGRGAWRTSSRTSCTSTGRWIGAGPATWRPCGGSGAGGASGAGRDARRWVARPSPRPRPRRRPPPQLLPPPLPPRSCSARRIAAAPLDSADGRDFPANPDGSCGNTFNWGELIKMGPELQSL